MNIVVEGESDRQVAVKVVQAAGHPIGKVRVKDGKSKLDADLPKYAKAAVREPWVVFRDSDNVCPVELRDELFRRIPHAGDRFSLRIAHTMTEAWLLADQENFASYFGVASSKLPPQPEMLPHAKHELLRLCRRSRKRTIRDEVAASETQPGPLFVFHLKSFAKDHWDAEAAADSSPSLKRAIAALSSMPDGVA